MIRLTFLGTKAEVDIPEEGHDDPQCKEARRLGGAYYHRLHSSLLVEADGKKLMLDAGEGHEGTVVRVKPDAILVTHAHPDHLSRKLEVVEPAVPVYMSEDTAEVVKLPNEQVFARDKPFEVAGFRVVAHPVVHSLVAPAVCFKVTRGGFTLVYAPEVLSIPDREDFLKGVDLYIGDGSSLTRDIIRKKDDKLIGHASMLRQLHWAEGVKQVLFTHVGHLKKTEADVNQALRIASDGRAYAGGGAVILDNEGISINGTLKLITFKPTADWSFIYGASDGFLHIETPELQVHGDMYFDGLDLRTYVGFGYYSRIGPDSDSSAYTFFRTLNIAGTWNVDHKLCPTAGAWGYLGDATYYWYKSYAAYAYFLDVLPKNGPDTGSVGNPTDYWFNGYFHYLRYKDLGSFQEHDDIALIRRMRTDPVRKGPIDRASIPTEIRGRPDPEAVARHREAILRDAQNEAARVLAQPERKKDVSEAERVLLRAEAKKKSDDILDLAQQRVLALDAEADEGIDVGASMGLAFGAIRQLTDRLETLERAIAGRG